jgi:hypothetical protein
VTLPGLIPGAVALGAAVAATAGCHEDTPDLPELTFASERATIGLGEGYERHGLCRGDLDHIDRHIERIEDLLAIEREDPVEVYLIPVEDWCPSNAVACYRNREDIVVTTWQSVDHELVHAVSRDLPYPSRFWSEGTAEMFANFTRRQSMPVEPEDLDAETLTNYGNPASFARYIVETYGWPAFRRIIRGDAIEDVLGVSVTEITQDFDADAPYSYPEFSPCDFPTLPTEGPGAWAETVSFTCDSPGATTFEFPAYSDTQGPALLRSVTLDAGTYEIAFVGELAHGYTLLGCQTTELDEDPGFERVGDVYNEANGGTGTFFPALGRQVLQLAAGTYRVALVGAAFAPADAEGTFTITRLE